MSDFDRTRFDTEQANSIAVIRPAFARRPLRPLTAIRRWLHTRRRRQILIRLLAYDDHMLDDMGYTRQDLLDAIDLPLRIDAHRILARWREQRLNGQR